MKGGSASEEKQPSEMGKTVEGEKHTAVGLAAVENKTSDIERKFQDTEKLQKRE